MPRESKLFTTCVALSFLRLASFLRTLFDSVNESFAVFPGAMANGLEARPSFPRLTTPLPTHPITAAAGHTRLNVTPPFAPTILVTGFSGMPLQAGGPGGGGTGGAWSTTGLAVDVFDAEPSPSVAITRTRNESPTFRAVSGSVLAVAPGMSPHPLPSPKQRCHW